MPAKNKPIQSRKHKSEGTSEPQTGQEPKSEATAWLTPSEAMKYLGISHQTLYNLMNSGTLPFYTIKNVRKRRIKKEDLDALMEKGILGSTEDED